MATLDEHISATLTKLLVVGDGGSGKTGGLVSLVEDGYKLKILDFDDGIDVLAHALRQKNPALLKNVEFVTLKNKMKNVGGVPKIDGPATAFSEGMKALDKWLPVMGEKDVLVIDSATFMGKVAMQWILQLVAREDKAEIQDWGAAMNRCEAVFQLLTSPVVKTNVIINTHVNYTETADGSGIVKGFPNVLGNKLSPIIGTYFNTVLVLRTIGTGDTRRREYLTKGNGLIEGKCAVVGVPTVLPHETGLADFFRFARGQPPKGKYDKTPAPTPKAS